MCATEHGAYVRSTDGNDMLSFGPRTQQYRSTWLICLDSENVIIIIFLGLYHVERSVSKKGVLHKRIESVSNKNGYVVNNFRCVINIAVEFFVAHRNVNVGHLLVKPAAVGFLSSIFSILAHFLQIFFKCWTLINRLDGGVVATASNKISCGKGRFRGNSILFPMNVKRF